MRTRRSEILLLIGTALLLIGPALTFFKLKGPGGEASLTGYKAEEGSPYILAGIVIGVMAIALFFARGAVARRVLGVIALLGAAFAAFAAVVDLTDLESGVPSDVNVSSGIGTWIVLVGSVLTLIGSIMALVSRPAAPPAMAPGPPAGPPPGGPVT